MTDFTPTGGQTIFPRINYLKTFGDRFAQRHANGRIFLSGPGVPSVALNLNFASSKSLTDSVSGNNLVTYTRASTGTYVGSDGLIKTSPVNLATYSEEFDNGYWTKVDVTVTANNEIAPDGTSTADTIVPSATSAGHYLSRSISITNSAHTTSVYAKAAGNRYIQLDLSASYGVQCYANFDLQDGVLGSQGTDVASADIQELANGWYRCSMSVGLPVNTGGSTFANLGVVDSLTATRLVAFTGDGTSGVHLWGAQLEEGPTATTYIPTSTTISGAPRFDHDPVTLQSLGLLIEAERTNLLTYSDFGNNAWAASSANIVKRSTNNPAPDGTNTATVIGSTTNSGADFLVESIDATGNGLQTFTFYAKGTTTGQSAWIMYFDGGANRGQGAISLDDGSVSNSFIQGDATLSATNAGDGWWRCQLTLTPAGTAVHLGSPTRSRLLPNLIHPYHWSYCY